MNTNWMFYQLAPGSIEMAAVIKKVPYNVHFTQHSNQMQIGRRQEQGEGDVPNLGGVPESLCDITEGCFPKAQESKKEVGGCH